MQREPVAIRIMPMAKEEFHNLAIEDLQRDFFLEALARRPDGHYFHYRYGIKAIPGTFVLFQYRNAIVACATFNGATRFKELDERGHAGVMYFEPMTIRVFEPIFLEGMNVCWPDFKGFSNVKQVLSPEGYGCLQKILRNIRYPDFRSF